MPVAACVARTAELGFEGMYKQSDRDRDRADFRRCYQEAVGVAVAELPGLLHSQPDTSESVEMARFRSVLLSLPRSPEVAMLLGMAGELADGPTTAAARVVARGREIDGDGSQGENGAEFGNVFSCAILYLENRICQDRLVTKRMKSWNKTRFCRG